MFLVVLILLFLLGLSGYLFNVTTKLSSQKNGRFRFLRATCHDNSAFTAALISSGLSILSTNVLATTDVFTKNLTLQGIQFQITHAGNILSITPSGLKIDNTPILRTIDGKVTGVDIGDINTDGSPEIYIYLKAKDKGSLIAFSTNHKKTLTEIYVAPMSDDPKLSKGFRGNNEFMMLENFIAQRFPLYNDNDANPSGGWRQLQYKLVSAEAGWTLKLDKIIEY